MTKITIHRAKTNLSKLIARVEGGRKVILCRGNEPVAMLVPYRKSGARRPKVGAITSSPVKMRKGCFDPMTDDDLAKWGLA